MREQNPHMLKAKKSLGQHFLTSKSALEKIISAGNLHHEDTVLEIGPGTGILTRALLQKAGKIVAVEKDVRASELLNKSFEKEVAEERLVLIEGDILEGDIEKKLRSSSLNEGGFKIVANIPYYITGAILEKFLEHGPRPSQMTLLVQKEVAERIIARNKKESILSISVKAFGKPEVISNVPRGAFSPAPKVDSAILNISQISGNRFSKPEGDTYGFFRLVNTGFSHKRKMLLGNLSELYGREKVQRNFLELGLPENVRAEDLEPDVWFKLFEKLSSK